MQLLLVIGSLLAPPRLNDGALAVAVHRARSYMQLVKQTRNNPFTTSRLRAWELFGLVAATMPPSKVRGARSDSSGSGRAVAATAAWRVRIQSQWKRQ
jgi:hypothetical protein